MNRRNFLGAAVGAAVAGPQAVNGGLIDAPVPAVGGYSLNSSTAPSLRDYQSQLAALTRRNAKDHGDMEYYTYEHLKSFSPAIKRMLRAQDMAERDYWRQHSWLTQQIAELTGFKQP